MPDQTPAPPPAVPTAKPAAGPTIQIAEEFGTAKKNLPPAKVVLIAVAGVIVVVLIASFFKRATPHAEGSLDNVTAVEIPAQQSTMAALTFTLRNVSDKDVVIQSLKGRIKSDSGDTDADAVSAVDLERYYQAFPALKAGTQPGLPPESRIHPGQNVSATIIVLFPVTQDLFNRRQRTSVVIQPYDGLVPIVLTR